VTAEGPFRLGEGGHSDQVGSKVPAVEATSNPTLVVAVVEEAGRERHTA
jgi:hypothetical protein